MLCARAFTLGSRLALNNTKSTLLLQRSVVRNYGNEVKSGFSRHTERRRAGQALKEVAQAPSKGTAFNIGQGAVAGAAVLGIGALGFYGLGFASEPGAIDRQVVWPQYVKERIRDTYMYFGASIGVTAATAAGVFSSPALMNIVGRQGWIALGVSIAAMIGSGMLVRSLPYEQGFGSKQMAWILHCGVLGAVLAPICLLGGPILTRAAWYTAGMVGGLSTVAACAPSDKFLNMGGPLAMGLGVVFMSSIASNFLPPTTAMGAGIYSIALYGGLILFGGFLLYDTQKIIYRAENHPQYATKKFDPINNSVGIFLDTVNIFIRIAQMLAMGGRKK